MSDQIQCAHCHGDISQGYTNAQDYTHGGNNTLSNGDERFILASTICEVPVVIAPLQDEATLASARIPLTWNAPVPEDMDEAGY